MPSLDVLIRKLEHIAPLSGQERLAVATMPMEAVQLQADQVIVREGDCPPRCSVLLEGFACSWKVTGGKRQILSFFIPGDIPDLQSLHVQPMDHTLGTITRCQVGFVEHEVLHDLCLRHPGIASALWRKTLIDGVVVREWILNVGRREARARVAYVLCELLVRMRAVGMAKDHAIPIPITPAEFSDAVGLSTVHVNRVIEQLRAYRFIRLERKKLTVLDWEGLKQAGDFDPAYLHLSLGQEAA